MINIIRAVNEPLIIRALSIKNYFHGSSRLVSTIPANQVCLTDDGRTIVCWHPEPAFPYEYSLPLPENKQLEKDTILKVQSTSALKAIYRPKPEELERQELMKITYTTKHRWFPIGRPGKRRPPHMDRPYL